MTSQLPSSQLWQHCRSSRSHTHRPVCSKIYNSFVLQPTGALTITSPCTEKGGARAWPQQKLATAHTQRTTLHTIAHYTLLVHSFTQSACPQTRAKREKTPFFCLPTQRKNIHSKITRCLARIPFFKNKKNPPKGESETKQKAKSSPENKH